MVTQRRTPRMATLALVAAVGLTTALWGCSPRQGNGEEETAPETTAPSGDTAGSEEAGPVEPGPLPPLPPLQLEEIATLDEPVAMATRSGSSDVFIAERGGAIRQLTRRGPQRDEEEQVGDFGPNEGSGDTRDTPGATTGNGATSAPWRVNPRAFLDLTGEVSDGFEQGLLGIVFSSDGRTLYVHYTNTAGDTVVESYRINDNQVDTSSRRLVFTTPQPYANHNGGQLAIGPDGFLYVGLGDGGGAGDPDDNGQNPFTTLGAILRLDPDGADDGATYAIPPGNPFARGGGAPEVWAWGLRNPWRFSFDSETGDLWIGDVGQSDIEEINLLRATTGPAGRGVNLGWPLREGTVPATGGDTTDADLVDPVFEYRHGDGACSVTGGYVYRGTAIAGLEGVYIFGDWCDPQLRGLIATDGVITAEGTLGIEVPQLTSLGQDRSGELWLLSQEGKVWQLVAG
jgi:glucose/arabinose dehydrogenase